MSAWTHITNQQKTPMRLSCVRSGGHPAVEAYVSTIHDPAVTEMMRRLRGLPGVVNVAPKAGEAGPVLVVTMNDLALDRIDAVINAKWDVLDHYRQSIFDVEIRESPSAQPWR